MTITIELPDQVAEELQQLAAEQGVTLDELAQRIIQDWIVRHRTFKEAVQQTLEKNAELYRRLAQG
jgi:predicted transcriptional regulator